ncbi:phosphoglycerate mutase-like protein 1 isoform X2 [Papaver somniferum]|uniref:phosphoglycerate mutase-like protein 1 isoform X2 n=1 Tax=Papaver somniferum TaxID=3469 RepID=UPI000E6F9565|nr:phosphoglycerate mutase-like protein 1 isoform X2 [Papaver somniferum]
MMMSSFCGSSHGIISSNRTQFLLFPLIKPPELKRSTPIRKSHSPSSYSAFHTPLLCFSSPSSSSNNTDMDSSATTTLFPLHRTKTLHLVRHAQGFHNVEGEKNHDAYLSEELFDAQLTPLGWQQVDNLHKHITECGIDKKVELVIVSPLLRTMQTAVGAFGGGDYADGMDVTPLMVANGGNSNRSAVSSLNTPPFVAVELCREHLGVHPCDRRRGVGEYRTIFPAIDFSLIENEEDVLWKADVREADESLAARGMKFMNWLWTRKEKEIAVVTHSGFLFHTLSAFGKDCHPTVQQEICKHFANCELRSVVIIDRGPPKYPRTGQTRIDYLFDSTYKRHE